MFRCGRLLAKMMQSSGLRADLTLTIHGDTWPEGFTSGCMHDGLRRDLAVSLTRSAGLLRGRVTTGRVHHAASLSAGADAAPV